MSEQIEPGEGWRLLGPDESVDGFGDEHKTSKGVWVKVPSYFTLWKAKDFIAVRRRMPAKPKAIWINGHRVSFTEGSVHIGNKAYDYWFSSHTEDIRQLADWLTRFADWREAQDAGK
jgi:hypothetical protein